MRLVRYLISICAACLPALMPQAADKVCAKVVVSGDPGYPPFSWYDGRTMRGAAIELAQKAFEHAGIPYEVRYVGPFNRVLQAARTGMIDMVAELKDTPERRAYLAYSGVAIFNNPVAVFVRGDSTVGFHQWKDLAGLHGGITLGNKFGGGFDEYLEQSLTTESANSIASNFAKLELGRIDYFVNSYYPALNYLESEHKGSQFKTLHPFITSSSNFAAWAKSSPCLSYMHEFDRILSGMVKSGEARRILESNLAHLQDEVAGH